MSVAGEQERLESNRLEENQEPFKKRFKAQLATAADFCMAVIDNKSDEERADDEDQTSTEEDTESEDSSDESEDEQDSDTDVKVNWLTEPPPEQAKAEYKPVLIGLKVPPVGKQPRDYFNLLMNKSMYNLIIKNTNVYATAVIKGGNDANMSSWKPLREDEMKKFLGLVYLMGIVELPNIKLYWSTDKLFNFPSFRQIMSLERFLAIFHNLRFCDDSVSDVADPLRKIRPLVEFFNILMESIYTPSKELVMNNPMDIGKGIDDGSRLKAFTLCEPSGMVQKYLIHNRVRGYDLANRQTKLIIVRELLEGKLGKGHSVFMGDYFTSVPLVQSLKAENTYSTGQLNEKNWKRYDQSGKLMDNDQVFQRFTEDGVCILKWKEKRKAIICVSSEFDVPLTKRKDDETPHKTKPVALVEYNRLIRRETDRLEQMVSSYPPSKKRIKWYRKAGLQILNIIMINSYYLYHRYATAKKTSPLKFKLNLIKTLLYSNKENAEMSVTPDNSAGYGKPHVLDYVGRNDKGFRKRKRCKYCISERGIRVDSYYHCITCDTQPGFCLGHCFIKYHKYDSHI